MPYPVDDALVQRHAIYESLIAHTRPIWSGVAAGQGAVVEHLAFHNGERAFRVLMGTQASQNFERLDMALAWLLERDPELRPEAISETARARIHIRGMTASGAGIYFIHPAEERAIETCFIPMVLSSNRLRLERETLIWHSGHGYRPDDILRRSPDKGVEFSPRDLPHVLSRFQRSSLKMSWSDALADMPCVPAKLMLFQRYARHDPDALFDFLHEHSAI
ncbi:hypothetical protein J7355_15575 [Endozoicomonas sp. G2_2]|uniref:hypothetical protein n=1 Tax=Endozoicomonas sp. G2_2 TaxID=2821092 RepID=UPI001ADA7065|nr:hypothetical protein [Endozoicomonas sp. G2_2]MBO9471509.1 hypothetical protein [Endozoicomonas sp. G2_2]